jgi:hypothetical protein
LRRSFAKDVLPQVNDMIKFARDENIPIIYTLHGALTCIRASIDQSNAGCVMLGAQLHASYVSILMQFMSQAAVQAIPIQRRMKSAMSWCREYQSPNRLAQMSRKCLALSSALRMQ